MKIQEVTIEGYQSHTNSTFRLSPGLTVITGPSDAGKTAIIRALRWFAFNEPTGEAFLHTIRNPDGSVKEAVDQVKVSVTFDNGITITKTRRKGKTTYTPFRDELKTDLSRRSLMITEEMVLLLIFWRLIQNTEKRKAAERGIEYNPDNLVFCTRKGTYIYPRNFTKMWSENLRSMGIDHKRFHDLRHTVATVMLEDGEAMNTVQEQLGHYDAGFTASRYGHVTAKMRNSAAVKLGERLEKVRNPEAEDAEDANSIKNEDTVIPFQEGRKLKSAACKIK